MCHSPLKTRLRLLVLPQSEELSAPLIQRAIQGGHMKYTINNNKNVLFNNHAEIPEDDNITTLPVAVIPRTFYHTLSVTSGPRSDWSEALVFLAKSYNLLLESTLRL